MKKFLKIFSISLGALLLLAVIVFSIALWFVFTPEKLTPIVRSQASKYINCQSEIGNVELTFFSTFPKFGLKADRLILINPVNGAPNDTLIRVSEFTGIVNVRSLINDNELIVSDFRISNGMVFAFVNSLGHTNFDIFSADTTQVDTVQTDMIFKIIDIENIDLKNMDVAYLDQTMNLKAEVRRLTANIRGMVKPDDISGAIDAKPFDLSLEYGQADSSLLKTEIRNFSAKINGGMKSDIISGTIELMPFDLQLYYQSDSLQINTEIGKLATTISGTVDPDNFSGNIRTKPFQMTFSLDDEKYLQNDVIQLDVTADADLSGQSITLKETSIALNDLNLDLSGTVVNDTLNKNMNVDVKYKFSSWPLKSIMALIPASFSSYTEGIDAGGMLSSEGSIDGVFSESSFPLMDIRLLLEKGTLKYDDFPVPLTAINADVNIRTDLKSPQSHIRINRFHARTPKSSIKTSGTLNNILADIRANLDTEVELSLKEFAPMIPDSLNITAAGMISGKVKSAFTMSQIEKMELEKMKLSGSLALSGLDITYDSLSVKTDRSAIDFALPAQNPSTAATGFVFANMSAQSLEASKINTFNASLTNAEFSVETSDVRDTTKLPVVRCVFRMDTMKADMDTIHVTIAGPAGNISVVPRADAPKHPVIDLTYQNSRLQATMGDYSVTSGRLGLEAGVVYDPEKEDIVFQWMPRGSIDLEQGKIIAAELPYPVEMPAIQMKFDPETFAIEKGNLVIDKSDFSLSGKLDNISSWFNGDSLLIGKFDFVSEKTDILQLMNLANGLGYMEEEKEEITENNNASSVFLVPKGVDLTLHTNINKAAYGDVVILSEITGDVRVRDGILVLDDLTFTSPAAKMQLTAMYRTPRKNHLFVGLDYHMFDVEISELLQIIPEIDSIMPMLRSFGGKGEFHIAAETYVDSMYNIKMSTLRGASSIRGTDLVLMDGETFSEIAKALRFSKRTENKVDSLSVEFTIFRNEVDVYPFLIVMDKYKAVVGGRHDLDMSFDYNISVVQSPLPFRLAVRVFGTPEKMKYRPDKSRFPDFYRPVARKEVESKQLELRRMIRDALTGQLKKE